MTQTDALYRDLQTAYARHLDLRAHRRRLARVAAVACATSLVVVGAGFGAAALLGWPAPLHVRNELASVDQGLPADLRLNPDVEHASAVAATPTATLYSASLKGGGSCTEIVTAGDRGRGARCTTAAELAQRALDVTLPTDDGAGPDSPVVLGGRINAADGSTLEAVYADGSSESVELGEDRYFLFEVPARYRPSVHAAGLELVARSSGGAVVGRSTIPADWDDPAVPDTVAPLYVGTRSDESDLTKVYGLEGHVSAPGAVRIVLDYGDGTRVSIPIRPDGSYVYAVPAERVDDFMQPRTLEARDDHGAVVASAPVAAVAYWRGRERSGP
jgi:hypothetical protein